MALDIETLVWLFPIAFILHDFEELILFEPWLKKNASFILERIRNRVPPLLEKQFSTILGKTTTQFAVPICLIFVVTVISALLALELGQFSLFFLASSLFFVHGFMHVGQAVLLRRYTPGLITSVFVVIPYGSVLFSRVVSAEIVAFPELAAYFVAAILLAVPFIIGVHIAGDYAYKRVTDFLVG